MGIEADAIPSPLNAFQSFDGLSNDDGGVGEMLAKTASQVGMVVPPELIALKAQTWLEIASRHRSSLDGKLPADGSKVTPEQLDRLESVVSRLESVAGQVRASGAARQEPPEAVARRRLRDGRQRRLQVLGTSHAFLETPEAFRQAFNGLPQGFTANVLARDPDGDIPIVLAANGEDFFVYLRGDWLGSLEPEVGDQPLTVFVISEVERQFR